jgi:hypothetical protein
MLRVPSGILEDDLCAYCKSYELLCSNRGLYSRLAGNMPVMEYLIVFGVVAMMTVCVLIIARCLQPA